MAYVIGNQNLVFSLDDIEHGVLRSNRIHPGTKKQFFISSDPRVKYIVQNFEPRIHFALNCGAKVVNSSLLVHFKQIKFYSHLKGCPPISFYTVENLERGLKLATANFITSETNVNIKTKAVELSKLLLWYKSDFINDAVECDKTADKLLLKYI